jgi:uncharacterized membrane protein YgdD (TMEM256/DUF423 family)
MTNSTLQKNMIQAGAGFAALAVALGALAAHELKPLLDDYDKGIFEKAVQYNFYHALGLLAMGFGARRIKENIGKTVFYLMIAGIIFFSGSLYMLSTSKIWAAERVEWLGAIAPIGGVSFIAGWILLALKGYKPSSAEETRSGRKVMEMQRRKSKTEE